MSTANLLRHLSFINNFGIFHPQSQWLSRNAVRCFSHNTNTNTADASGLPVRYIPKRRQFVDNKQSAATDISLIPSTSVFPPNSFQVDTTQGNMLKSQGPILNHCDGLEKDLTDEQHIKVHKQVVDCMKTGQLAAHDALTYKIGGLREGTKLNQELGSGGLVDEECMEASEELFEEDAQSNNTYFKPKPDKTRQGAKSSGLREGIKLNQELGSDGLVDEECMEASEEVFEDAQLNNTYFKAKPDKTRQGAEKLAVQLLARRAFTALELRKKLGAKLFPLNIVETVVRDFQNRGLINDGLYAETFSHSRWKSSSWGPRRIKQAEVILKIRAEFAASATANTIVVQMALPTYTSRVSFELELGAVGQTTDFKEANKRLEWNLKKIVGGAEHTLRAKLTFSHESHGNLTKEAGPVTMSFTIPMFNASRLQLWDVLSNDEVVSIALKNKEMAAKTLVEEAAAAWKTRFPRAKVDDCTVVCLFFQDREDSLLSHTTKDISPHIHK